MQTGVGWGRSERLRVGRQGTRAGSGLGPTGRASINGCIKPSVQNPRGKSWSGRQEDRASVRQRNEVIRKPCAAAEGVGDKCPVASAQSVASAQAVSGNGPQARLAESLMGQRNENPSLEKRGGGIKGVLLILCPPALPCRRLT